MNIVLDRIEARVIGALMEKSMTTPENYPLSVNALVAACNQKSSREPVMNLSESTVQSTLDILAGKYLVRKEYGRGSRVARYHYLLYNAEIGDFRFSPAQRAVICLLLLRGPQTPGELRSRADRMHTFDDVADVIETLEDLMSCEQGPFVMAQPREPGRREVRYAHLFCGEPELSAERTATAHEPVRTHAIGDSELAQRLTDLEARVATLEAELRTLRAAAENDEPGTE
ncbi:MAG: DUF480 domain-containing protein [Pseudomonadales bacterium]